MDMWRYYEVTHASHTVMNPSSEERLDELADVLGLTASSRVLDVGCGHAELLIRWNRSSGATGIGIDASPHHSERARRRVAEQAPEGAIEVIHGRGEEFTTGERFDVAVCLGASWIWGGLEGTLRALEGFARPGGVVVSGEPFWKAEPPDEYLAAEELTRESFHSLGDCRAVAHELGLTTIWMRASSGADWDRYEMTQSAALDRFALEHPDDPDLPEIRAMRDRYEESYVRWGRDVCGWAIWAFRTPSV